MTDRIIPLRAEILTVFHCLGATVANDPGIGIYEVQNLLFDRRTSVLHLRFVESAEIRFTISRIEVAHRTTGRFVGTMHAWLIAGCIEWVPRNRILVAGELLNGARES